MITKTQNRLYSRACKTLGVDPAKLRIVGRSEYENITGHGVGGGNIAGRASWKHNIIWLVRDTPRSLYYHEIIHILFPNKPHWWIYCAGWKLVGHKIKAGLGMSYGYGGGQFVDMKRMRELPSRVKLIALARQAAQRKGLGV